MPSVCRKSSLFALFRPRRRNGAFTLIELLTVIAILLVLGGIALGAISGVKQRANIARARSDLAALAGALEEFKRFYGDYPQLGAFVQATATPTSTTAGPGVGTVQARLFNCLTGCFGPKAFAATDRLNGPNFLDVGRFSINGTLLNTFLVPTNNPPNPPFKQEQNVCLLDPWGRRYIYYYKNASNPGAWQATSYVLYSAGPVVATNGNQTAPIAPATGLFLATQSAEMADNIYANP